MILATSMPYEDDVFAPDAALEDLLRPDDDELALMKLANRRKRALAKKKRDQEIKKKVVLSMLDGQPGSAVISGSKNENMGPIVEEREREHLQAIFDPLHNARQIAKELALLEDHLIQPPQHCPDCIRKHLLRAEAYADEAMSLDEAGEFAGIFGDVSQAIRGVSRDYLSGGSQREHRHRMAQRVRKLRKNMSKLGFSSVLSSRMKGDAPPQPYIAEPVSEGSANVYGDDDDFGKRRKRTRRKSGNGYGYFNPSSETYAPKKPEGPDWSETVGNGSSVLTRDITEPQRDVYQLQEFLKSKDLIRFTPNGVYDANTENAVAVLSRGAGVEQPKGNAAFDQRLYRIFIAQDQLAPNNYGVPQALALAGKIRKLQRAQEALVKAGLLTDEQRRQDEDGIAGPLTQDAIKRFQAKMGQPQRVILDADGMIEDSTLNFILNPYSGKSAPPSSPTPPVAPPPVASASTPTPAPASDAMPVADAQRRLNTAGANPPVKVDGTWGSKTSRAVEAFQRDAGLPVSGSLDPATVRGLRDDALLEKIRAKRKPAAPAAPAPPTAPAPTPPTAPTPAPAAPAPAAPASAPATAAPAVTRLPRDYAADPTGSNVALFKSRYPTFAQMTETLLARERQLRSLARFGGTDERQISKLARDWWSLSKQSGDPWPALHGAWLAGKAGDTKLAGQILSDVSSRFVGTAAGNAASAAMTSLPAEEGFTDKVMDAAPYIAAGAGLLLVTTLLFRGVR